jgi:glucose-fructose oxidoreductase
MRISRRAFLAGTALVVTGHEALAQTLPWTQPATKKLGWAIVGLGSLSRGQLLPALTKTTRSRLAAIVTGSPDKDRAISQQYKLDPPHCYTYQTFDRIKDDPEVDVVYVVLPNSLHAEYTIRAAKAGKHVFCEKPMAVSVAECRQMIGACAAAQRKLSIAYRMFYDPNLIEMRRLCRDGAIGKVTSITSTFGFNMRGPGWRLSKKMAGGGPLMDIGIYCVNAARFVTGEEPTEATAKIEAAPDDPRFKEVEAAMDFSLRFPGGALATCRTAYNANLGTSLRVVGERGWINLTPAFMYAGGLMSCARDGGPVEWITRPPVNGFEAEIDDFSRCIMEGTDSRTSGEEGLRDMLVIDALYRAAAEGKAVTVPNDP